MATYAELADKDPKEPSTYMTEKKQIKDLGLDPTAKKKDDSDINKLRSNGKEPKKIARGPDESMADFNERRRAMQQGQ
jgi:hypothetical protein